MSSRSVVGAEFDRELSDSLIDRHRQYLEAAHPVWGAHQAKSLARQRGNGSLSTLLWTPTDGKAVGLVWVQKLGTEARLHGVWMDPAGPESLESLLGDVQGELGCPITVVTDLLPGLDEEHQPRFFEPKGFWHRAKVILRRVAPGSVAAAPRPPNIRAVELADLGAIVGIYVRAYSDRPGEFWTWGSADAWAWAEEDVMSHRAEYGGWTPSFLPRASFVWEDEGKVVGAILVEASRSRIPYVEDLIVEPQFHRRGIGRFLLESTIDELTREGAPAMELGAIRFGAPYRLYQRLGFEELPAPTGKLDGHWVRGTSPF